MVELSAEVGQSDKQLMPLRNVGNIPLILSFETTHWPDFFTVQPGQLRVPPGEERHVAIQFCPKHHNQHTPRKFTR